MSKHRRLVPAVEGHERKKEVTDWATLHKCKYGGCPRVFYFACVFGKGEPVRCCGPLFSLD
jgi:hypothetical protein